MARNRIKVKPMLWNYPIGYQKELADDDDYSKYLGQKAKKYFAEKLCLFDSGFADENGFYDYKGQTLIVTETKTNPWLTDEAYYEEVRYCFDCRYWNSESFDISNNGLCKLHKRLTQYDDFCSFGEENEGVVRFG